MRVMTGKKTLLCSIVAALAIGGGAIWQHKHRQRQAEKPAHTKSHKAHPKPEPVPQAPPKKLAPKATVLSQAAREDLAEEAFVAALRRVFLWRSTQPDGPLAAKGMLERFAAIPCDELAQDHKAAWQSLLAAWRSLGQNAIATDPRQSDEARRAALTLNAMLKARGDGDIAF